MDKADEKRKQKEERESVKRKQNVEEKINEKRKQNAEEEKERKQEDGDKIEYIIYYKKYNIS